MPTEKTQPFCPRSTALNWTGKGLNELKQRITIAVAIVDEDKLRSVWTELDYRIDICRARKGSHVEHL